MTDKTEVRITNGRQTVVFGRGGYVLHALNTGAAALAGTGTAGRAVTFSGYILPEGETAETRAREMETLCRRVRRIVSTADGFTLSVGERSILLTADTAPIFSAEAPFTGDEASFFTVHALARNAESAYFFGAESTLAHGYGWLGHLIFPFTVTEETIFAERVSHGTLYADNPGDVQSGFIAVATAVGGTVTAFTITGETGEKITVTHTLTEGESIVIDTRPGHKTVAAGGTAILGDLSWDSVFFPLLAGENRLSWSCEGTGSVSVTVSLTPRYL